MGIEKWYDPTLGDEPTGPNHSFNNYYPQNQSQANAVLGLRVLSDYIKDNNGYIKGGMLIAIKGETGVGKTHLLNAFLKNLGDVKVRKFEGYTSFTTYNHNLREHVPDNSIKVLYNEDLAEDIKFESGKIESYSTTKFKKELFDALAYCSENNGVYIFTTGEDIKSLLNNGLSNLKRRDEEKIMSIFKNNPKKFEISGDDYRDSKAYQARYN